MATWFDAMLYRIDIVLYFVTIYQKMKGCPVMPQVVLSIRITMRFVGYDPSYF